MARPASARLSRQRKVICSTCSPTWLTRCQRSQISNLKKAVFDPNTLNKLEHFEIKKDYPRSHWKASDYFVGATCEVDAKFPNIQQVPRDAKFVRVVEVEPDFYHVPGIDLLKLIVFHDKEMNTWNSYAFNRGRIIDVIGLGRNELTRSANRVRTQRSKLRNFFDHLGAVR
jgi:hypothetical protein